jgi:hypothetical protein
MRASWRAVAVAAFFAVTLALNAQETCLPPAQPEVHWVGLVSGCTAEDGSPCEFGETIAFSVTPLGGGSYQGCVTYSWDFGDGDTSTAAAPTHVYAENGTFFVLVGVRARDEELFDGKQVVIIPETVVPKVEHFSASATVVRRGQLVVLTWSTKNATSVRIEPIGVNLNAVVTRYAIFPTATRTYTLTAFGDAAFRASLPVTVVVGEERRRAVRH